MRNLILVLGDQLDYHSAAFDEFDADQDRIWMAEVEEEATHVWCHQLRIAYFFSAMRHFRDKCRRYGRSVEYHELSADAKSDRGGSFVEVLKKDVDRLKPEKLIMVPAGDFRVHEQLMKAADDWGIELEFRPDRHFFCSREEFQDYAEGKDNLVLEYFYRKLRKQHGILIEDDDQPVGGQWNLDHDNRESFGKDGPQDVPKPKTFDPDDTTREVLQFVKKRFAKHPGRLDHFTLPVTARQATSSLKHFIQHLLPNFGRYEDAMWSDEAFLYHSRLSAPLNVKLLDPRDCIEAAVVAYREEKAPLNSVEGFVRQILGWREFIRGVYWLKMPGYQDLNHLQHSRDVPPAFWDGETEMECIRQSMAHVLDHGYSHHIHRLMVLGNFAQLWGVDPKKFHEWHMAMYLDAIDWVSLPNALGMSQFGDGGIVGTKPYCSSGNYINRMSNFCKNCRFDHKKRSGEDACPFTTLYWHFLDRHSETLKDNPRMNFAFKNLENVREDKTEWKALKERANKLFDSPP